MKTGLITAVNSGNYFVYCEGKTYMCRARGLFRKEKESPIAGDIVDFDEIENYLQSIHERKNSLLRPTVANIDQVIIVASLCEPEISLTLLNRYMVLIASSQIHPILCISKCDHPAFPKERFEKIQQVFTNMGFQVLLTSSTTNVGIEELRKILENRVTIFTGQSGVGKSSLLNALMPELALEVQETSKALGRGKHTTRVVKLHPILGGWVGDTPGFSFIEFAIEPTDLAFLYPGFHDYASQCKFRGCLHDSEPGCSVKEAMEKGKIDGTHYQIYLTILKDIKGTREKYSK